MSRQVAISDSDSESDQPLLTNESESIRSKSDTSAEVGDPFEPLNNETSIVDRDLLHDDSMWLGSIVEGSSFHETDPQGRSSPVTNESDFSSSGGGIMTPMNNRGDDYMLNIAKKILEIVIDRQVDYKWMFKNDVALIIEAPPKSEEGKLLYYHFIQSFKSNCSENRVKYFCEKLSYRIQEKKSTKGIKAFLSIFWTHVVCNLDDKLQSSSFTINHEVLLVDILGLLEEVDIHSCIQKLLTITMSTKGSTIHYNGLSYLQLRNEEFPLTDSEKVLRKLFQLLTITSPEEKVSQFYGKHIIATRQEEKFEYVKKRLIFFWKRILWVIETKFEPGEAELSERLLTEMTKIFDETFDREELSDIVTRIVKSVETLEYSFEWAQIFQKKFSLAETTDDDDGRSAFCKFIHRLQMSQEEETVEQFCDELHREISKGLVPEVTRKRLLVFWNRVFCLIHYNFRPGEAEVSKNLLNEIRKSLIDTFKEGSLLASAVKKILHTLETSDKLFRFSEIFSPYSDWMFHLAGEERKLRLAYDEFILVLKVDNGREKVDEFMYLLYESINENITSGDLWKLCVIFWKRVLSFVDQVSGEENNDFEIEVMDTLVEILKDTFCGEDISNLCEKILKNMEGCRKQLTLQRLFQSDVMNHKPPCEETNGIEYYKVIQRLKFTNSNKKVHSFCDHFYENISEKTFPGILHTLLLIFWIRVQCLIKDNFSPIKFDFDQKLFVEIIKIMNETFKGDNCLMIYNASHSSCNSFRTKFAAWVHDWYYKRFYRNSPWLREHRNILAKPDNCCYFTWFIFCLVFPVFVTCFSIIGGSIFGVIYYFIMLFLK